MQTMHEQNKKVMFYYSLLNFMNLLLKTEPMHAVILRQDICNNYAKDVM